MKNYLFAILLLAGGSVVAAPLQWDGGDLQFSFSTTPYQQREPTVTAEEQRTLSRVAELIKQQRLADAEAELTLQLKRRQSAALWFSLAQIQQHQGLVAPAVDSLNQALNLMPAFIRAHESLGTLLTRQGDYPGARPHLRQAASQGAQPQIFAMLGYGYLQSGQPLAAKAAYSQALMLAGDNPQWTRGLLHAAMASDDVATAQTLVEQLLAQSPDDPQLFLMRAGLAQKQQQWSRAIASLEAAYQLRPDTTVSWQLAQLYLNQGLFHSAQPHLRGVVEQGIEGRQQPLLDAAAYLVQQQQARAAEPLLAQLRLSPALTDSQQSQALWLSARLLEGQGGGCDRGMTGCKRKPRRALLSQAIELDPLNGQALLSLAMLEERSEPARAEVLYQRAAALPTFKLEALQRHAQMLLNQQAYQRAETLLQAAARAAPNDRRIRDNLALVTRVVQSQQ